MKVLLKISTLLILLGLPILAVTQVNLVPNPGFEDYSPCPDNTNQVPRAAGWMNFGNTSEYYNSCSTNLVSVPDNAFGYQFPASGQAYCGLVTYDFTSDYREIIGIQLTQPLEIGSKYYVSLKINFSNWPGWNCPTNKLGVKFTNTVYSEASPPPINNVSHVFSDSIISDTLDWFEVFGSYTPSAAFEYLMIGNFFDDDNTDTIMLNTNAPMSYYYVDDVCVTTDSSLAVNYSYSDIAKYASDKYFRIFPNPSDGFVTVSSDEIIESYVIFSSCGRITREKKSNSKDVHINLSNTPPGIYFVVRKTDKSSITKKLIIN